MAQKVRKAGGDLCPWRGREASPHRRELIVGRLVPIMFVFKNQRG